MQPKKPNPDPRVVERSEVTINVNLKSDGRTYSEKEVELLSRIQSELDRKS
jgi:hypothetical protein